MARWFRCWLGLLPTLSVVGALMSFTMLRFHSPPHQTGRADFPHPAFGQTSPRRTRRRPVGFPLRDGYSRPLDRLDVSEVARPKANRSSVVLSSGILELRPLRSAGVTRRPHYYGPLRHPTRPSLLLAEVSLSVTHAHQAGLPVLRSISSYVHADANTPAERSGAYVTRFPDHNGLPRFGFGSASAIDVSRRAQRSLTFRPARSLSPHGTLF